MQDLTQELEDQPTEYTAFSGLELLGSGTLADVALHAKARMDADESASIAVFEDRTGRPVDLDLRGTPEEVLERLEKDGSSVAETETRRAGPGRPRLGVVAREVTLLPRHWDWLSAQRGGASATLRRLVEEARRRGLGTEHARRAQEAAHRFMFAMAGNLEGFEEASRAFFAKDYGRFDELIEGWPEGVREYTRKLVGNLLRAEAAAESSTGTAGS